MSCSERQAEANRQNALKSTGPNTPEGKAASSANAYKHGMASEVLVLPTEDCDAFAAEERLWIDELAPDGGLAERIAQRAFRAYVRLNRCDRNDDHELLMRTLNAKGHWDIRRAEAVAESVAKLQVESSVALVELENSAEGCLWLQDAWLALRPHAESGTWGIAEYRRMVALLGVTVNGEQGLFNLTRWVEVATKMTGEVVKLGLDPNSDPDSLTELNDEFRVEWVDARREEFKARETLKGICDEQIEKYEAREVELKPLSDRSRAGAENRALFDDSSEGKLRRRYAADAERSMHRNMKEAKALSKAEAVARLKPCVEKPLEVSTLPAIQVHLPREVVPAASVSRNEPISAPAVSRDEPIEAEADAVDSLDMTIMMKHFPTVATGKTGRIGANGPMKQAV